MSKNPAFTQAIVVTGAAKTIYIGGQDAVDKSGKIVGKGDLKAQTEQVFENLQTVLAAARRGPGACRQVEYLYRAGAAAPGGVRGLSASLGAAPQPAHDHRGVCGRAGEP